MQAQAQAQEQEQAQEQGQEQAQAQGQGQGQAQEQGQAQRIVCCEVWLRFPAAAPERQLARVGVEAGPCRLQFGPVWPTPRASPFWLLGTSPEQRPHEQRRLV